MFRYSYGTALSGFKLGTHPHAKLAELRSSANLGALDIS